MDALLLDFNGVVVHDEPLHFRSFHAILAAEGIVLEEAAYYADYLGFSDQAAFREAFRRQGREAEPSRIQRLVAEKARAYAALAERELVVVPGVRDFVRSAATTTRLAVVSGAIRREIESGLSRAGIADLIEFVVSAEDVPTTKPDPAGYRMAMGELAGRHGGGAWRAVVIEDSLPGLAAARALGAGCIMLSTSHDAAHLQGRADRVWASFEGHSPEDLATLWRAVAVT